MSAAPPISAPSVAPVVLDAQSTLDAELSAYLAFRDVVRGWDTPQPRLDDVLGVVERVRSLRDPLADIGQRTVDHAGFGFGAREGRSFFLGIAPGLASLRVEDETRRVRAEDRARAGVVRDASALATGAGILEAPLCRRDPLVLSPSAALSDHLMPGHLCGHDSCRTRAVLPSSLGSTSGAEIVEWSRKSRARMYWRVLSLDLGSWADLGGDLALVTLTLPDHWQAVAPVGHDFKLMVERVRRRWTRALGAGSWACIWKLEFQRRGAPHWHALMRVPALVKGERFEAWLSRTWAECVGADDTECRACLELGACECAVPDTEFRRNLAAGTRVDFAGAEYSDPRRIATYFLGHSSKHTDGKEYQHIVPVEWRGRGRGPGRFWGYSGLSVALVEVEVTQREHYALARVLRKVKRARDGRLARLRAARGLPARGARWQASYSLGGRGGICGGWVGVNDGLLLALDLGRYLHILRT